MATITITPSQTLSSGETVTATKLNNLGNPSAALTAETIVAADLATDAVTTTKILNASVTPAKLSQPLTLGTAQATTSGTSFTFSSIPSWVKRVTVMFDSVSTNGASRVMVQLGDAGGVEDTGYLASCTAVIEGSAISGTAITTGFPIAYGSDGTARTGALIITNMGGNKWVAQGVMINNTASSSSQTAGVKTLSDTLTQIRIIAFNGTDAFDAGAVNVMYE